MDAAYALGLSWMCSPGWVALGALLVRVCRELDPDEARQDRMWVAARACLDARSP